MKPIYEPKGAAKEYGDLALNIYTGCPHRCYYCFAPGVLHRDKEQFHSVVEQRKNIVEETRKQLERENITGKLIHLCFTCDPYPTGYDSTPTREIIQILKEHGNHVQILTKGDGSRDFDLLDENDWYGVTISAGSEKSKHTEPGACSVWQRIQGILEARKHGIKTWVSFEPVLHPGHVFEIMTRYGLAMDKVKIGKLNYHPSKIDWAEFGYYAEKHCRSLGLNYYIKDSLRKEMEARPWKPTRSS